MPTFTILPLATLKGVEPLAEIARAEGYNFLDRMIAEWADGTNRFETPGETLFGAYADGLLIGTAGLTRQSETLGRVRRVYVAPEQRGRGVATALVTTVLDRARGEYAGIVLFTDTERAARLYEAMGFVRGGIAGPWPATHRMAFLVGCEFGAPP